MFIDASAIVAILAREPGSEALVERILKIGGGFYVSPVVRLEVVLALSREKRTATENPSHAIKMAETIYDQFVDRIGAKEIDVNEAVGRMAVAASAAFGKAVGHPARLNFGDCFAYACAKAIGVGLVYKGDDFVETDLA